MERIQYNCIPAYLYAVYAYTRIFIRGVILIERIHKPRIERMHMRVCRVWSVYNIIVYLHIYTLYARIRAYLYAVYAHTRMCIRSILLLRCVCLGVWGGDGGQDSRGLCVCWGRGGVYVRAGTVLKYSIRGP